ncbi:MAG: hypothetical protein COA78_30025 [Blastopirellula sp.]|nr:MAG: hypothetical protein COA78_30025 [Blastopirellula sp.]
MMVCWFNFQAFGAPMKSENLITHSIDLLKSGQHLELLKEVKKIAPDSEEYPTALVIQTFCLIKEEKAIPAIELLEKAGEISKEKTLAAYEVISRELFPALTEDQKYYAEEYFGEELPPRASSETVINYDYYYRRADMFYKEGRDYENLPDSVYRVNFGLCDITIALMLSEDTSEAFLLRHDLWGNNDIVLENDEWEISSLAADDFFRAKLEGKKDINVDDIYDYAYLLYFAARSKEALAYSQILEKKNYNPLQLNRLLSHCHTSLDQHENTVINLNIVLAIYSENAEDYTDTDRAIILLDRGQSYFQLKEYDKALKDANRAYELDKFSDEELYRIKSFSEDLKIQSMLRLGQLDEVEDLINNKEKASDKKGIILLRAQYYSEIGDYQNAKEGFIYFINNSEIRLAHIHEELAEVYEALGETQQAKQHQEKAKEIEATKRYLFD